MRTPATTTLILAMAWGAARGQGPTVPDPGDPARSRSSSLGTPPGSGGRAEALGPGTGEGLLGGPVGSNAPHVPTSITRPGAFEAPAPRGLAAPAAERPAAVPLYGNLDLPGGDDEGPPDGLTLDRAIDLLIRGNLDLKARAFEIPQARADVLTAGLRANPILYVDGQLIPYGAFRPTRPGGQTQYDVNISHPVDLTGKRRARVRVASEAGRVLEAQFQDAVRVEVENLGVAFVDALAAAEAVRQLRAGLAGAEEVLAVTRRLQSRGLAGQDEVDRLAIQRDSAALGLEDAEGSRRRAGRALGQLLNLPPAGSAEVRVRGAIRDAAPPPPPPETLIEMALAARPDLCAYRLGVRRAEADVQLARAERLSDVYVLYQPYTFQDNGPTGQKGSHSWALGVSVPVPVYNRNQGNIRRSTINAAQSRAELAAIERRVVTEVEQAAHEYAATRSAVARIERDILPAAARVRDDAVNLYRRGGSEVVAYLAARREYNDVVREYRDLLVRHRRSMLALDAAVGLRVLP